MVADYYAELGVGPNASPEEIRSAYRKQAVRWHPDKWRRVPPELAEEAKKRFQKIQEAYSVLSDGRKRKWYNAGLYDPSEQEDEGLCDFVEELLSVMTEVRKEKRTYGLGELQNMLSEMMAGAGGSWCSGSAGGACRSSKRARVGDHGCPTEAPKSRPATTLVKVGGV
ncbi:uncharacterized protein LOC116263575 [Nymphaea colorata]|nr:uncharacterized protein LOC116263575 [Nymphaea colorata]